MSARDVAEILDRLSALGIRPTRLENDSRRVRPGDIFVAYPGSRLDGRAFIPDVMQRGAAAVLWEAQGFRWVDGWRVPNLAVDGLQALSGDLAHAVYGRPSEHLRLIGVTGTNGKTSCSQWIAQALAGAGHPGQPACAVIGTLGNGFPGKLDESANTTPDALALHSLLARFRSQGAVACAMEVSSIGLDQQRCNGAHFDIAVFTNLTRDHLDYHASMETYAEAKRRLFQWPGLRAAVFNLDDAFGRELAAQAATQALASGGERLRIGYTVEGAKAAGLDLLLSARDLRFTTTGMRFRLQLSGGGYSYQTTVEAPLVGRYNVANLLAVAGTLLAAGVPPADLPGRLAALVPPPGRMQRIGGHGGPLVVVDYAHSPDALDNALQALRPVAEARGGRLVCVFGCGGDRDRGKRPLMGDVASRHADAVWLTSDNPRSEDPLAILADIRGGAGRNVTIEVDRTQAIRRALAAAADADVVLVAGKGHEPYQEIAGVRHPYSDAATVQAALAARSLQGERR